LINYFLAAIAEFTSDLRYLPGPQNVVADALSRPPNPPGAAGHTATATTTMENDPINFQEMATEQENCAETQKLISGPTALTVSFQMVGGHRLAGDTSTGVWRPLVPLGHRHAVFNHIHNIAHPGTLATERLLCYRFVWSGINRDVAAWTKDCAKCQQSKVHRHIHVKPLPIPIPQRRFAHIHIALVGPLTISVGHSHILTIIDRTSRWMEAIPLTNTAATSVAAALFSGWIPDLACRTQSHLTEDHNLLQIFGMHCVFYFRLSTSQPLPTTHRTTAWLSGSTAASRTPCGPAAQKRPGSLSCPGCYWSSIPSRERTPTSHLPRLYMAHL
jgi:hypothetical protein